MIKLKFSNRAMYTFIFLIVIVLASVVVSSVWMNPGSGYHDDLAVRVSIDGQDYDLQDAIDNDLISNNCGEIGNCGQICIGTDCETEWPAPAEIVEIKNLIGEGVSCDDICLLYGLPCLDVGLDEDATNGRSYYWDSDYGGSCRTTGGASCSTELYNLPAGSGTHENCDGRSPPWTYCRCHVNWQY